MLDSWGLTLRLALLLLLPLLVFGVLAVVIVAAFGVHGATIVASLGLALQQMWRRRARPAAGESKEIE